MASLFCVNCGSGLVAGERFCRSCGAAIAEAESPTPTPAPTPSAVTVGGRFRLEGVLGRGAAGTVYLAYDESLGAEVALKSLDPALASLPEFLERFRVEAATLAGLSHPNVVAVRDYLEVDSGNYLVMERVEGPSLRQLLTSYGRLAPEQACGVLCGALSGLGYVHERGLLHGDIKPENVLVDSAGVSQLTDFGQAVPLGSPSSGGSAPYMSPEAIGGTSLDARSDLYSMGVVLYECLGGEPPFMSDQLPTLLHRAIHETPPAIPQLATPMSDLVARCLAKDPAQRPQSAHGFFIELTEAARNSYGADWMARAGVASLAGAVGVGVAVALGSGSAQAAATTASAAASAGGASTQGAAIVAQGTRRGLSHSSRWLSKTLLANKTASVAVAAVVVGGAVAGGVAALGSSPSHSQLASSYVMEYHNITVNASAGGELSDVTENSKGVITGQLTVDPPLEGSGPFRGTVHGSSIAFNVNDSSFLLLGQIGPQGSLSGPYSIDGQKGTWHASPQGDGRSPLAAPTSTTTSTTATTTATTPILGSAAWGPAFSGGFNDVIGFGDVAPSEINPGGLMPTEFVTGIKWSNWGAPRATGQGQTVYDANASAPMADQPVVTATVVAFDLGSCNGGPPAYEEVVWYVPAYGGTFDPSQAINTCTGP